MWWASNTNLVSSVHSLEVFWMVRLRIPSYKGLMSGIFVWVLLFHHLQTNPLLGVP